jgi:glycosyltransferase involved in cell wall biosynthesis
VYDAVSNARPDVVIVRGLTRWIMRQAAVIALMQRRNLVVYDQEPQYPGMSTTWVRRVMCRVAGMPHVSPKPGDVRRGLLALGSAQFLPFGRPFPSERVQGINRKPGAIPRILLVSKYRERKRHEDLLHALAGMSNTHRFALTLCGEEASEDDTRFCRKLAELSLRLGLSDRVEFHNNVPHHEMVDLYSHHDLFVLPAVNEPAAISPIEAAWCGCAVVIAADSGTRGYIPPGPTFEFESGDVAGLRNSLSRILQDSTTLTQARERCHTWINEMASDAVILDSFERLLK